MGVIVGWIGHANSRPVSPGKPYSSTNATSRNGAMNSDNPRVKPRMRSSRGVLRPARSVETTALPAAVPILGRPLPGLARDGFRVEDSREQTPPSIVRGHRGQRRPGPGAHHRGRAVDHAVPAGDHAGRAGTPGGVPGHLPPHDQAVAAAVVTGSFEDPGWVE